MTLLAFRRTSGPACTSLLERRAFTRNKYKLHFTYYMTTIAVKDDTMEMLKQMQRELNTASHDETIRKLIAEKKRPKHSLWGVLRDVKEEFKREKVDRIDRYT